MPLCRPQSAALLKELSRTALNLCEAVLRDIVKGPTFRRQAAFFDRCLEFASLRLKESRHFLGEFLADRFERCVVFTRDHGKGRLVIVFSGVRLLPLRRFTY